MDKWYKEAKSIHQKYITAHFPALVEALQLNNMARLN